MAYDSPSLGDTLRAASDAISAALCEQAKKREAIRAYEAARVR